MTDQTRFVRRSIAQRLLRFAPWLMAIGCAAQISMPLIGYYRDRVGALRPLYGVSGAFLPGELIEPNVLSVAWSGSSGFAKTDTQLLLLDVNGIEEREEAPAGRAAFGFTADGRRAWVRFADGSCRNIVAECPTEPVRKPLVRAPLPDDVLDFERLGADWLLARSANGLYAIRIATDHEQTYEVPEPEQ